MTNDAKGYAADTALTEQEEAAVHDWLEESLLHVLGELDSVRRCVETVLRHREWDDDEAYSRRLDLKGVETCLHTVSRLTAQSADWLGEILRLDVKMPSTLDVILRGRLAEDGVIPDDDPAASKPDASS